MTQQQLNDRYLIIRALGSGGFGNTFLAEDTQMPSGKRCVIKQLKPIANNPQIYQLVQERFQREAAILEQLGDGNEQIPRLYAYFVGAGQFYLVQEWIEGETLSQKVPQQGIMSESAVREMLVSLLLVLDYVHAHRIVHRDIKPDNIILRRRDGKPVLIDFGAVKETMGTVVNSQGNTTGSIVIGTPGFMPSEQAAGRPVYASDLYSLGLTAIYALTGKIPQELAADLSTGEILWRQHALSVSPGLAAVLDKAIQSHSRDRFPSTRDMLNALYTGTVTIPATIPISEPTVVTPHFTKSSVQTVPLNTTPSPQTNGTNSVIVGMLIAGGLIVASIVIAFALKQSPQSLTPITVSPGANPQNQPSVNGSPSSSSSANPTVSNSTTNSSSAPVKRATLPEPEVKITPKSFSTASRLTAPEPSTEPSTPNTTTVPQNVPTQVTQSDPFSWLSSRKVTEDDLVGKNAFKLDILRNSIYARHGRRFNNKGLQLYFNSQPWYEPIYLPDDFPNNLLSRLEQDNAAYILEYQKRNNLRWAI